MGQLIKDRQTAANEWAVAGSESAATATRLILPLTDYLQAGATSQDQAVLLKPEDQDLGPLLPHLAELPLIAIDFGSSGEGRGYTQARLLRERHGYRGELRAIGKVRADQMYFLARCGFDAFELADGEDPAIAIAQLDRFSVAYQSGPDGLTHPRRRYGA
ncbi:MAG TPA: DUF934 domain-containing protein [Steroidobacteraceae bacterium]|nr:DUF934 domain-containing protein [Steroidobacteraceae bacterium]